MFTIILFERACIFHFQICTKQNVTEIKLFKMLRDLKNKMLEIKIEVLNLIVSQFK